MLWRLKIAGIDRLVSLKNVKIEWFVELVGIFFPFPKKCLNAYLWIHCQYYISSHAGTHAHIRLFWRKINGYPFIHWENERMSGSERIKPKGNLVDLANSMIPKGGWNDFLVYYFSLLLSKSAKCSESRLTTTHTTHPIYQNFVSASFDRVDKNYYACMCKEWRAKKEQKSIWIYTIGFNTQF